MKDGLIPTHLKTDPSSLGQKAWAGRPRSRGAVDVIGPGPLRPGLSKLGNCR